MVHIDFMPRLWELGFGAFSHASFTVHVSHTSRKLDFTSGSWQIVTGQLLPVCNCYLNFVLNTELCHKREQPLTAHLG